MKQSYWIGKEYRVYLESYGIPSERVYKIAGMPLNMEKEGIYINRAQYIKFMNAIEESMDDVISRVSYLWSCLVWPLY